MSGPFDRDPSGRLPEPIDVELERALEHAPPPRARDAFRSGLRERFLDVDAGGAEPVRAFVRRAPRPATAARRRGWAAAAALIAAGLVLAFWLARDGGKTGGGDLAGGTAAPRAQSAPSIPAPAVSDLTPPTPPERAGAWTVLKAGGAIEVDGRTIDGADAAALERALAGAERVRTAAGGELRLRLGDVMLVELGSRDEPSEIVLKGVPRQGCARALEALAGGVRVATGPAFDGLSVATPDLELAISGTALAVDVYAKGTCVCCSEGHVAIQDSATDCTHALEPGKMAFVFHDHVQECADGPVVPDHAEPLAALMAEAAALW